MEYCEGGELYMYIINNTKLSEEQSSFFYFQIISGLEYIHLLNIVHRDLKPENLLMTNEYILKIIDFGLSNYITDEECHLLETPCGSPAYVSPEMLKGNKYDGIKTDIWSTGIILFFMLCGYLPFNDKDNIKLYQKIIDCKVDYPNSLSEMSKDLLRKILEKDSDKRITIEEIKKHPFYLKGKDVFESYFIIYEFKSSLNNLNDNNEQNDYYYLNTEFSNEEKYLNYANPIEHDKKQANFKKYIFNRNILYPNNSENLIITDINGLVQNLILINKEEQKTAKLNKKNLRDVSNENITAKIKEKKEDKGYNNSQKKKKENSTNKKKILLSKMKRKNKYLNKLKSFIQSLQQNKKKPNSKLTKNCQSIKKKIMMKVNNKRNINKKENIKSLKMVTESNQNDIKKKNKINSRNSNQINFNIAINLSNNMNKSLHVNPNLNPKIIKFKIDNINVNYFRNGIINEYKNKDTYKGLKTKNINRTIEGCNTAHEISTSCHKKKRKDFYYKTSRNNESISNIDNNFYTIKSNHHRVKISSKDKRTNRYHKEISKRKITFFLKNSKSKEKTLYDSKLLLFSNFYASIKDLHESKKLNVPKKINPILKKIKLNWNNSRFPKNIRLIEEYKKKILRKKTQIRNNKNNIQINNKEKESERNNIYLNQSYYKNNNQKYNNKNIWKKRLNYLFHYSYVFPFNNKIIKFNKTFLKKNRNKNMGKFDKTIMRNSSIENESLILYDRPKNIAKKKEIMNITNVESTKRTQKRKKEIKLNNDIFLKKIIGNKTNIFNYYLDIDNFPKGKKINLQKNY